MASNIVGWSSHHSSPCPDQSCALPSAHDIRYKPEHRRSAAGAGAPRPHSRPTTPVYHQPSPWAMRARTPPPLRYDDSENEGSGIGSDSDDDDDDNDDGSMSMDIDENDIIAFDIDRHRDRNGRSPLAPLCGAASRKRKFEDAHHMIPPPSPHEPDKTSFDLYYQDLPDDESAIGDEVDMDTGEVLAGLHQSEDMYPVRLCTVCGSKHCKLPRASRGHLGPLADDDIMRVYCVQKRSSKSALRARTIMEWVMRPSRPRTTPYYSLPSPLAPKPEYCYRRIRCPHSNCAFVGASVEHWKHHAQTFQHKYDFTRVRE
ncbi:hypothetical protein PsYK624_016170 [Phanerochaete sordida]|uniref:Uncharacterized protein n=1 Tax=Phanerochaete sordida TaxID=48140 RepID=A0A9P3FZN1_9APHY|nr:hypothetical protein PsYK624_016170 [Phanerochaete sordida]